MFVLWQVPWRGMFFLDQKQRYVRHEIAILIYSLQTRQIKKKSQM